MAGKGLPWHCCGMFPEDWWCWLVFFEAAWLFLRLGGASRVSLKQGGLPEGRQDWEVCTVMEADFVQLGRACSDVSGPWGSSMGLVVLGMALLECSTFREWEQLAWLLRNKGALPQSSQNWQEYPAMEADFPWPARVALSFLGCGTLPGCRWCWEAAPREYSTS